MRQAEALTILKTGANVFLTGEPGSGKTHTINAYVQYLRERGIEPSITASTGIASTHVGGMTIHSWSGIGIRTDLTKYDLDQITQHKKVVERIATARVLIIDEVSMLSGTMLSMVDAVCREVRRSTRSFGGLQVIMVGDFFQLPPVQKEGARTPSSAPFAFLSPSWVALNPLICYLDEQHRQADTVFTHFLSDIRRGAIGETHVALMRTRYARTPEEGVTQLYTHTADVDRLNDTELKKIKEKGVTFLMTSKGSLPLIEQLKRGCLSPETLLLKEGARVMCTKNDSMGRFVNGTLGEVVGFDTTSGYPQVKVRAGRVYTIEPDEWTMQDGGKILARISQIPLRLAWAITVHKSQGMSLDAAHMDLSGAFEYGQGYVALSRVRTLQGVSVSGLNEMALQVHPVVRTKDVYFRAQSEKAREAFMRMSPEDISKLHTAFLRACGGSEGRQKLPPKVKPTTYEITSALLKEGHTISHIARTRKMTEGTILSHVEHLHAQGILMSDDIRKCIKGNEYHIEKACMAWKRVGGERLVPVFEYLEGKVPYDTIRLARLLV